MPLIVGVAAALLVIAAMGWWSRCRGRRSRMPKPKDRRRSYRMALATSVFVYGWTGNEPFSENTETLNVSAGGGLIPLSVSVNPSQELILTNLQTNEDLTCRVARLTQAQDGKVLVGLDFLQASPNFWQIDFVSNSPRREILTLGLHSSSLLLDSTRQHVAHS